NFVQLRGCSHFLVEEHLRLKKIDKNVPAYVLPVFIAAAEECWLEMVRKGCCYRQEGKGVGTTETEEPQSRQGSEKESTLLVEIIKMTFTLQRNWVWFDKFSELTD
ncbi:hypothetical protein AVEN_65598-1, partial [Araneus ventricosus]